MSAVYSFIEVNKDKKHIKLAKNYKNIVKIFAHLFIYIRFIATLKLTVLMKNHTSVR